jgi:Ras-related GTP-binding protein A/B
MSEEESAKIAILGLSNAGKTSIVKVLKREFQVLDFLKPTISVERNIIELLGKDLVIWDFGGQDTYRSKYLDNPEKFFTGIDYLFYVLDVQDKTLLGESIMYYQAIHSRMRKYSPKSELILLFHKYDPEMEKPEIASEIKNEFIESISSLLEQDKVPMTLYHTSIFDPLSVVKAISQPLFDGVKISENLSQLIETFCKKLDLSFVTLLTENFFEIGFYIKEQYKDKIPKKIVQIFKHFFENLDLGIHPLSEAEVGVYFGNNQLLTSKFTIRSGAQEFDMYMGIGYVRDSGVEMEEVEVSLAQLIMNMQKIFMSVDLEDILAKIES